MALGYSITAKLDAYYDSNNIEFILNKGITIGLRYSEFILGKIDYSSAPYLSLNKALEAVIQGISDSSLHCLVVKFQETFATLHFVNDGKYLLIMFSGMSFLWSKKYSNGKEDIDIARYTRLLLDLVDDFKILELHVEKD